MIKRRSRNERKKRKSFDIDSATAGPNKIDETNTILDEPSEDSAILKSDTAQAMINKLWETHDFDKRIKAVASLKDETFKCFIASGNHNISADQSMNDKITNLFNQMDRQHLLSQADSSNTTLTIDQIEDDLQ